MVLEAAKDLFRHEGSKLDRHEYGIQFMDYMGLQLSNSHRIHQRMGKRYPLYTISREVNRTEYSAQPHRLWLNGVSSIMDSEIHFSAAMRITSSNESKETLYFQTARMKQEGIAHLLIIDRNAQNISRVKYIDVYVPSDNELNMGKVEVHELHNHELYDCIKQMKRIQSHSDIIIDPPPHFEKYNTPINILNFTDKVEAVLNKGENTIMNTGLLY